MIATDSDIDIAGNIDKAINKVKMKITRA